MPLFQVWDRTDKLTDDIQSISQTKHIQSGVLWFPSDPLKVGGESTCKRSAHVWTFGHAFVCGPESWGKVNSSCDLKHHSYAFLVWNRTPTLSNVSR
jgi:hypothetical protein